MLHIELLVVQLHLPGAASLKEKRARTRGIRDRWGKLPQIALAESGALDQWQRAEWSFLILATDTPFLEKTMAKLEHDLAHNGDFIITEMVRERC